MKRFDVALEISKQLITLCSAMLVGVSALANSILNNEADGRVFTALVVLYIFLCCSIIAGLFHLGAITNLVEVAERTTVDASKGEEKDEFVSLFDNKWAPISLICQQGLFLFAIISLIAALLIDRCITDLPTST
ncbi:hypothetical protein DQW77_12565 [Roseovarius sp. TE539]|uniref:hypothetical protein n=1 Tax=Roseovarius sp. TE539 TaxID=2249812 RepID=UPI000DDCDA6D|nr:hypothetical protein [Roseovarius sp. TE539]RBI71100.1 hypothetical protein DQW77_12565 [Roseovarius sp. TE539]